MVPLSEAARDQLEKFGAEMQQHQEMSGGLLNSTLAKARGTALRLSLALELMNWSAKPSADPPPLQIDLKAFLAATALTSGYLMPMAERVYGDAAASPRTRNTATLARWIAKTRPLEIHVRHLQRHIRLPGLGEAAPIREACDALVEAGWLTGPPASGAVGRPRVVYEVRPELWKVLP